LVRLKDSESLDEQAQLCAGLASAGFADFFSRMHPIFGELNPQIGAKTNVTRIK